jgi:MSHA biogenesis protein MshN
VSVIHQMLKKLDERGQSSPGLSPGAVPPHNAAAVARWRLPLIVAAGGAAIAFTAFADWPAPPLMVAAAGSAAGSTAAPLREELPTPAAEPARATTASTNPVRAEPQPARVEPQPARVEPQPVRAEPQAVRAEPVEAPAPGLRQAQPERKEAQPQAHAERKARQQDPPGTAPSVAPLALPASLAAPVPNPARIDKRAVALKPEQQAALLQRQAAELAQAGQRRAAVERAREALAADARHAPSRLLAAVLEHELGHSERAAALLREGLTLQPGNADQALLLARIQVAQGDAAAALSTLDSHAVEGAESQGLRGGILAQQGRFQAALPAYESAARQQPANPMWWFGLGVALDAEGLGGKARLAFARAQQLGLQREDLQHFVDQRLRTPE